MKAAAWLAPVACLIAIALPAGLAGAAEPDDARPDAFVIVDEPDDLAPGERPPLARMAPEDVEALARDEPALRTALRLRPGSPVRLRFYPQADAWVAAVRDRGSDMTLASVRIDDTTGRVIDRFELPLADWPSRSTERQAIDAAVEDPRVRRTAREWGGLAELRARGELDGCCWEVDFFDPDRTDGDPAEPVLRADVHDASREVTGVWTGLRIAWSMARGDRDGFGGDVNERFVWLPMFLLFALVAIDWARPRTWFSADVAALLALGVSHELFQQGRIEWSVPLAVPPLVWLLARMAWIFARGMPEQRTAHVPRRRLARLVLRPVPVALLLVFCVLLAGMRIGITLDGGNVIDVGYAGVAGARLELEGDAPWGNMPDDNPRGDTYGPANYLAYVPAVALLDEPDSDDFGSALPAATWTAIVADSLCVLLLAWIGWRWISRRGAVLLAAGWLACPWTLWAMASSVNDALLAVPLLAAFALLPRASLRGLLVGMAAMVKFAPLAALAPMLHVGAARRPRQALFATLGAAVAIGLGLAWAAWRIEGTTMESLQLFWERTIGFQAGRGSPFSIWGLYDWTLAQRIAQAAVVLGLVLACLRPRARGAWQVAAGAAAAIIAVQLVVTHWFYLYVPWFVGFVLLVLVAARERPAPEGAADMLPT